ncbi:hypothetical protein D0C16_21240 [Cellvibrio sp. KY-GH-1]|nr:hypothetical protein D0C16_21240 [Cellvibrio sp. KY-GH-1]
MHRVQAINNFAFQNTFLQKNLNISLNTKLKNLALGNTRITLAHFPVSHYKNFAIKAVIIDKAFALQPAINPSS